MPKQVLEDVNADLRAKAALEAVSQIKQKFGEGSIMRLGEAKTMEVEAVTTGCLSLDLALGVGGIPRGRIIEIYGPESSGKTTLAQHIVAEVQKLGGRRWDTSCRWRDNSSRHRAGRRFRGRFGTADPQRCSFEALGSPTHDKHRWEPHGRRWGDHSSGHLHRTSPDILSQPSDS